MIQNDIRVEPIFLVRDPFSVGGLISLTTQKKTQTKETKSRSQFMLPKARGKSYLKLKKLYRIHSTKSKNSNKKYKMFTKGIEAQGFPIDFHPDDCVKLANHWETDMSEIQPVFLRFS